MASLPLVALWGTLLLGAAVSSIAGAGNLPAPSASTVQEKRMSLSSSQSRVGPAHLQPIVFEGKRYKEILNGELLDLAQRTGLMMIIDEATQARVAVVKVYDSPRDPDLEADVQDIFFTVFELDAAQREIRIANERGQRFVFRIDDRSVRALP